MKYFVILLILVLGLGFSTTDSFAKDKNYEIQEIINENDSDVVVPRGDLFLQQPLRIEGLKDTYHIGQKIGFTVKFDGIWYDGEFPQLRIEDSNHTNIWKSSDIPSLYDEKFPIKKEWVIPDKTYFEAPIIDKEGSYTLFVTFADDITQKDFLVKQKISYANTCKESLTLVTKYDGSHACVKPETKTKLIERGWALAPQNQPLSYLQKKYIDSTPLDFSNASNENPLGIEAKVVNEPDTTIMCPIENCKIPPTPHLVLTSRKGSQVVGYEVCDGLSCKKDRLSDGLYVWLSNIPENYAGTSALMISHINLGDLPWKKNDLVHIKVIAFPATLLENNVVVRQTEQIMIVDLGKSKIE